MSATPHVYANQLLKMEGDEFELVEGQLVPVSLSDHYSSEIATTLLLKIGAFVQLHKLGRLSGESGGFVLSRDPDTLLAPDIGFVRRTRATTRFPRGTFVPFAPDLAIEIISASDRRRDIDRKVALYLRAGTELIWVVDPNCEIVTVYQLNREAVELGMSELISGEDVLPGFVLPVREIFQDPLDG